jgi:hypothetical protein
MVLYNEIFGNNELFNDITSLQLIEPFMYITKYLNTENSLIMTEHVTTSIVGIDTQSVCIVKPPIMDTLTRNSDKLDIHDTKKSNICKISSTSLISQKKSLEQPKNNSMPGIFPKKPDNLFWCIYIALYGYTSYIQIGHRYGNIEIEEKQKMMILMTKNPFMAKSSVKKVTKVLFQEIMSDFMTNKKMTMEMLTMVATYYNKRFWITFLNEIGEPEPYFIEISSNDASTTEIILLYKRGKNDISILCDSSTDFSVFEKIQNTRFKFENGDTPLKAISTYKTNELEKIFDMLELNREPNKKYKKNDYYQVIMEKIGQKN